MSQEYKESIEDKIDWKIIDQLHSATSTFSSASIEMKKMFFILLGITIPLLIKLTDNKLDISLFVTIYVISITFWYLDSFTYFYQEKLRSLMDNKINKIRERNKEKLFLSEAGKYEIKGFTIEASRTNKGRVWRSITNTSVRLYPIVILINTILLMMFFNKQIG